MNKFFRLLPIAVGLSCLALVGCAGLSEQKEKVTFMCELLYNPDPNFQNKCYKNSNRDQVYVWSKKAYMFVSTIRVDAQQVPEEQVPSPDL